VNVEEIAQLYRQDGPFVSVYLDSRSDVVGADDRLSQRWKPLRRELADSGATEADLEAIDGVVAEGHRDGDTLAVFAAGGEVRMTQRLPDPPRHDTGKVAALPYLAPLLDWHQSLVPHVIVLADREGADLVAVGGADVIGEIQVSGDTEHIHRSAAGGWSQRRFQQRNENTWESNAGEVAEAVAKMAAAIDARLVVGAGDVRAVQFLQDALTPEVAGIFRLLDSGQRAADGSVDDIAEDVVKVVATFVAEGTVARLRTFREEQGQGDRAADGPARTLEALARAQVEALLVHDDPSDERTAWFGPEAVHVAGQRQTLLDMGVREPREGRLVDVAIRAALGTGAEVRIVPGAGSNGPTDGLGAILRHTGTTPG
jgi:peptide subunit release factor 1 (eRF1)